MTRAVESVGEAGRFAVPPESSFRIDSCAIFIDARFPANAVADTRITRNISLTASPINFTTERNPKPGVSTLASDIFLSRAVKFGRWKADAFATVRVAWIRVKGHVVTALQIQKPFLYRQKLLDFRVDHTRGRS